MTHAIRSSAATQGLVGEALQFERLQPMGRLSSGCVSIDAGRCLRRQESQKPLLLLESLKLKQRAKASR
jgi:hypothetical protein